MARGLRRLFTFLAMLWAVWWSFWFGVHSTDPDKGSLWLVFMLIGLGIFSVGPILTFLANGFKPKRSRIIDL